MCADDRSLCADDAVSLCADDSFAMCADDSLSMCADDALTQVSHCYRWIPCDIPIASLIGHGSTFLFRGLLMSLEGTNYLRIVGWNFGAWRLQRCCAWMNRPTFWTLKPPPGSCWWSGAGNKAWLMWLLLAHGSGESVVGCCWRIIDDSVLCLLMD